MSNKHNKVLVTGAGGFIGSHLTKFLLNKGYYVKALVQYNSKNNFGWLEEVSNKKLDIIPGDIRDINFINDIVKDIDVIYHLAALIAIPYSYVAPESYIETNIKGTYNICSAALKHNVGKILVTSTSEVYGTAIYTPIDEKHPKQPQSPYSASKIGADALAMSFYYSFELPLVIARPFNTYGPRQSARAIIPTLISQIAAGIKSIKAGNTSTTRDFNYVADTCSGLYALANCDEATGKEINISSNYEISIKDVFDLIKEYLKKDCEIIMDEDRIRPDKSEVFRLWGDNTLIKSLTDFKPKYNIQQGIEKTCEWFANKDNIKKYKTDIYNI